MSAHDVAVVGAGLAGLRAAQVLEDAGLDVVVIDKNDHAGGRLSSHAIDGYVIDEGFHVINPCYPELRASGALDGFDLRVFDPVVRVVDAQRTVDLCNPRVAPARALRGVRRLGVPLDDVGRLARLFARVAFGSAEKILSQPDVTAAEGLRQMGLSDETIDRVVVPFLRGALLDGELSSSWRFAQVLLRTFVRGQPGTHPDGVGALGAALRAQLSRSTVVLGSHVDAVWPGRVDADGGSYDVRAIVIACAPSPDDALVTTPPPSWRSQSTWWMSLPRLDDAAQFRVDRERARITGALDFSARAPERAPQGRSLIAASMIGTPGTASDDAAVVSDVARLYDVAPADVEVVTRTVVERALPIVDTPFSPGHPQRFGRYFLAGDHLRAPSIEGALVSGRRAAELVLAELGVGAAASA